MGQKARRVDVAFSRHRRLLLSFLGPVTGFSGGTRTRLGTRFGAELKVPLHTGSEKTFHVIFNTVDDRAILLELAFESPVDTAKISVAG